VHHPGKRDDKAGRGAQDLALGGAVARDDAVRRAERRDGERDAARARDVLHLRERHERRLLSAC
jgi:hypothetical protein